MWVEGHLNWWVVVEEVNWLLMVVVVGGPLKLMSGVAEGDHLSLLSGAAEVSQR
jgi:hypothetical protein